MDTEDRRYFKQQEITLWRKADKNRKSAMTSSNNPHVPSHLVGADGEIMSKPTPSANSNSSNLANDEGADNGDDSTATSNDKSLGLFQEESPDQGNSSLPCPARAKLACHA